MPRDAFAPWYLGLLAAGSDDGDDLDLDVLSGQRERLDAQRGPQRQTFAKPLTELVHHYRHVFNTNGFVGRGDVVGVDVHDVAPGGARLSEGLFDVVERLDDLLF